MRATLKLITLLAAISLGTTAAIAQTTESSTSIKAGDVKKESKQGDIDNEITNARLRASTGSKSEWSVKSSYSYSGGSVEDPFSSDRPLLLKSATTRLNSSLGASLSGKFRASKYDSFSAGIGMSAIRPFHDSFDTLGERIEFDNPFVQYQRVYGWGALQNATDITAILPTTDNARAANQVAAVALGHNMLTSVGKTRLTVGVAFGADYTFYSDGIKATDVASNERGRSDYSLAMYPFAEYAFSDNYQLRTVFGWFNWDHYRGESNPLKMEKNENYQSVGLGAVITRDIYLYPNIQFIADDIRSDKTNVGLSAYVNLF